MPPWKAAPGPAFANERRLGDGEIATLRRWAEARAPIGDRAAIPPPPALADGNTLGEEGRFGEAIDAFRRAVALAPSLLPVHANLGRALFVTGDVEGAVHAYEAALALDPGSARVRAMLDEARAKRSAR